MEAQVHPSVCGVVSQALHEPQRLHQYLLVEIQLQRCNPQGEDLEVEEASRLFVLLRIIMVAGDVLIAIRDHTGSIRRIQLVRLHSHGLVVAMLDVEV